MSRHFANWISAYVEHTEKSEAPELFHFWTGVSVVASCLRRRVWIDERIFQWSPNFYIIFVAPPGVATKSTTIDLGQHMLNEVVARDETRIKMGPNSLTWQALTVHLEQSLEAFEHKSSPSGVYQLCPLTINISELGTFLKPKDTDFMDFLTDMWDGKLRPTPWVHATKTTGTTSIINPWLNIIGCTTPGWMRTNFPAYMIEGGLTSRTIFLYADKKRRLVSYPSQIINGTEFMARRARLIEDLNEIASLVGPYDLTREARQFGHRWYVEHWTNRPRDLISDRYAGYLARKQTHIHKMAMVLAASQRNELFITRADLETSVRIISALENDMKRVFDAIGLSDTGRVAAELLGVLRCYKQITVVDLYKHVAGRVEKKDFDAALQSLLTCGTVRQAAVGTSIGFELVRDELQDLVEEHPDMTELDRALGVAEEAIPDTAHQSES